MGNIAYTENVTTTFPSEATLFSVDYEGRSYELWYRESFVGSSQYVGHLRVPNDREDDLQVLRNPTQAPYTTLFDEGQRVDLGVDANNYNEYGGIPVTSGFSSGVFGPGTGPDPITFHDMPALDAVWYAGVRDDEGRFGFFEFEWNQFVINEGTLDEDFAYSPIVTGFGVQIEAGGTLETFNVAAGIPGPGGVALMGCAGLGLFQRRTR